MARVPDASNVNQISRARDPGVRGISADAFGASAFEGLDEVGLALQVTAETVGELQKRRKQAAFDSAMIRLETELTPRLEGVSQDQQPSSVGADFVPDARDLDRNRSLEPPVIEADFFGPVEDSIEQERQDFIAGLQSEFQLEDDQVAALDRQAILMAQPVLRRAAAVDNNLRVDGFVANLKTARGHLARAVAEGTLSMDDAFERLDAVIEHGRSFLPEERLTKERARGRRSIGRSFLQGLANDDPADALALIAELDASTSGDMGLEPEDVERINRSAEESFRRKRAAAATALTAAVGRGQAAEIEIRSARDKDLIGDNKQASLLKIVERQAAEADRLARAKTRVEGARSGNLFLDPRSAEDRRSLNLFYENVLEPELDALGSGQSEERVRRIIDFVNDAGMIPDRVQGWIRGRLRVGDDAAKTRAAQMLDEFQRLNPRLLDELEKRDLEFGLAIAKFLSFGATPDEAVSLAGNQVLKADTPERELRRKRLRDPDPIDLFRDPGLALSARAALFGGFEDLPGAGFLPGDKEVPDELVGEFDRLFEQFYVDFGETSVAKNLAMSTLKRVWQVTNIGMTRWQKGAPEALYKINVEDTAEWIEEQLFTDLQEKGLEVPSGLLSSGGAPTKLPNTMRLFLPDDQLGSPRPLYRLQRRELDTNWVDVLDKEGKPFLWRPDWETSPEFKRRQEEAATREQRAIERARRREESAQTPDVLF